MSQRKPNVFIIGAAKAGTTALYSYLQQHPQACMSMVKEPHYFARAESHNPEHYAAPIRPGLHTRIVRDEATYLALFADAGPQHLVLGEASPSYFFDAGAAARRRAFQPEARLIALLREPKARAFSHYQMELATGTQAETDMLAALRRDHERPASDKIWGRSHLYVDLGFYASQLGVWGQHFPSEQMLILRFEDLVAQPHATLGRVYAFLGLPEPDQAPVPEAANAAAHPRWAVLNTWGQSAWGRWLKGLLPDAGKGYLRRFTHRQGYKNQGGIPPAAAAYLDELYAGEKQVLAAHYGISW